MSGSHTARFSSTREQHLFQILGPLQQLDPELAHSLVRGHPQLVEAAAAFPDGMESVHARPRQPEQDAARREPIEEPDYAAVGGRLISITEALDTDFKDAFELAFRLYAADSASDSPNQAPRECWPSAWEFRNIVKYPVVRSR